MKKNALSWINEFKPLIRFLNKGKKNQTERANKQSFV